MSQLQDLTIKDTAFYKQATEYLRSVDLGDFADAPSDSKSYARRNREWVEVVGGGGGSGSTNYELVSADFTAEAGKNYAVDVHPIPAVYPTFSYGGLVFTAKSPTSTATISWSNDGDLYGDGPNNFYIAGTETLNDIIVFINGNDFSFTVALDEGAELADAFPDDGAQEYTFSGGNAAAFAGVEATLPANPSTGDVVGFADARGQWGSYPLIVLRNGKKIEGGTANFTNNAAGTFFGMVYIDNTTGWRVLSSGTKPLNLTHPTVSGTYAFTSTNGTWTGSPTSYTYQWQMSADGTSGWTNINGATSSSYTAVEADEGKYVRVGVIATNANGPSVIVYSAASSAIDVPDFPTSGLLAFWKLDNVNDSSGNGKTLTNNNSVTFSSGKVGNAAVFNKTSGQRLSSDLSITQTSAHTFSFWVRPTTLFNYWTVIGGTTLNVHSDSGGALYWNNSSSGYINISSVFTQNTWTHIVLTHDGSGTRQVWKNGTLIHTEGNPISFGVLSQIHIGSEPSHNFVTDGTIDAVGVWNRALSTQEIAQLYNSGNGVEP